MTTKSITKSIWPIGQGKNFGSGQMKIGLVAGRCFFNHNLNFPKSNKC